MVKSYKYMTSKFICMALTAIAALSCQNNGSKTGYSEQLTGKWKEIMPVNKNILQGVELKNGHEASSIGMATLKYEKWDLLENRDGKDFILLSGKSIGNGITIDFTDTLEIISVSEDTMILGKGDMYRIMYERMSGPADRKVIGGSDAAMGYTYSDMLGKKIRVFEEGMQLKSVDDSLSTFAVYAVFSKDSSKVELFMPDGSVVLDRRQRPDGQSVWNVEDDDTYMLECCNDEWIISRRQKLMYASSGAENMIKAHFTGDEGKEIYVDFFNNACVAQVYYKGMYHILYQYVTASGYGYRNSNMDIRGKGTTLVLTDSVSNSASRLCQVD